MFSAIATTLPLNSLAFSADSNAGDAELCGFKQIRKRWNFPTFPGLRLHEGDSDIVKNAVYVPPGKDMVTADRSVGIAALPKSEAGPTLADYTRKTIRYYVTESLGGTMTAAGTTPGSDSRPLPLYQFKPGPKTPSNVYYQTSVFIEDQHCFIDVFFSAKSQLVHDDNLAAFKKFVSQFKKK